MSIVLGGSPFIAATYGSPNTINLGTGKFVLHLQPSDLVNIRYPADIECQSPTPAIWAADLNNSS